MLPRVCDVTLLARCVCWFNCVFARVPYYWYPRYSTNYSLLSTNCTNQMEPTFHTIQWGEQKIFWLQLRI